MNMSEIVKDIDTKFQWAAKDPDKSITLFEQKPYFDEDKGMWRAIAGTQSELNDWLNVHWDIEGGYLFNLGKYRKVLRSALVAHDSNTPIGTCWYLANQELIVIDTLSA